MHLTGWLFSQLLVFSFGLSTPFLTGFSWKAVCYLYMALLVLQLDVLASSHVVFSSF